MLLGLAGDEANGVADSADVKPPSQSPSRIVAAKNEERARFEDEGDPEPIREEQFPVRRPKSPPAVIK